MNEQIVREAIDALIARKEERITELRAETLEELRASARLRNELLIANLEYAVATLLDLQHRLRLCDCPDEAYMSK